MAQMPSMVVNVRPNGRNLRLPRIVLPYDRSVDRATGLCPNELHIRHVPRLRATVFERHKLDGNQSLDQDEIYPL